MKQTFLDTKQKFVSLGAASVIGFIMRGITRVFGLLFVASLSRYGASRRVTSIPFIMIFAVNNIIGPLVGYLNSKCGLRFVMVFGSLLVSLSLILSFFAEHIVYIIFFIGLGFGFGFGFVINLIPQALSYRFRNHIDKAHGLYHGASAIGGFALLVLTDLLLDIYGLSGTFLILAGIALHGVPASMLLFKPKPRRQLQQLEAVGARDQDGEVLKPLKGGDAEIGKQQARENGDVSKETGAYTNGSSRTVKEEGKRTEMQKFLTPPDEVTPKKPPLSEKNPPPSAGATPKKPPPSALFKVFLDPVFLFMNVTQSLGLFVFVALWTVMVDASMDRGVTRDQGVHVLLFSAIADTLGRTFLGFFTDAGLISRSNFAALSSALLGVVLLVFVWSSGYALVMAVMCLSGFLLGGLMMVGIGILFAFIEKASVRMATTSRYISYAPMSICQPFIIGYYRDTLKSYNGLFYIMSVLSFLGAVMYFVTPALARKRDRLKERSRIEQMQS